MLQFASEPAQSSKYSFSTSIWTVLKENCAFPQKPESTISSLACLSACPSVCLETLQITTGEGAGRKSRKGEELK